MFVEVDWEKSRGNSDTITVRTPINIALIKYWGKRDEERNLPTNSSLSLTLSCGEMFTETCVTRTDACTRFFINGMYVRVFVCLYGKARTRECLLFSLEDCERKWVSKRARESGLWGSKRARESEWCQRYRERKFRENEGRRREILLKIDGSCRISKFN